MHCVVRLFPGNQKQQIVNNVPISQPVFSHSVKTAIFLCNFQNIDIYICIPYYPHYISLLKVFRNMHTCTWAHADINTQHIYNSYAYSIHMSVLHFKDIFQATNSTCLFCCFLCLFVGKMTFSLGGRFVRKS